MEVESTDELDNSYIRRPTIFFKKEVIKEGFVTSFNESFRDSISKVDISANEIEVTKVSSIVPLWTLSVMLDPNVSLK
jgi:hypothetical protein